VSCAFRTASGTLHLAGSIRGEGRSRPARRALNLPQWVSVWHRRLLGEPGLAPLTETVSAFPEKLLPGWSTDRTFLLSAFYDLRIPGKYTVYVEVRDQSGTWLRSNRAAFEMQAPPQKHP
jgi:hypothetical protein